MDFAHAYALGKDKDKAIEYLNKAYEERDRKVWCLTCNFRAFSDVLLSQVRTGSDSDGVLGPRIQYDVE